MDVGTNPLVDLCSFCLGYGWLFCVGLSGPLKMDDRWSPNDFSNCIQTFILSYLYPISYIHHFIHVQLRCWSFELHRGLDMPWSIIQLGLNQHNRHGLSTQGLGTFKGPFLSHRGSGDDRASIMWETMWIGKLIISRYFKYVFDSPGDKDMNPWGQKITNHSSSFEIHTTSIPSVEGGRRTSKSSCSKQTHPSSTQGTMNWKRWC